MTGLNGADHHTGNDVDDRQPRFAMLPLDMCKNRTLPVRARILLYITAHANNPDRRWPLSLSEIARGTAAHRRQVEREAAALERGRVIKRHQQASKAGGNTSTVYELLFDPRGKVAPTPRGKVAPTQGQSCPSLGAKLPTPNKEEQKVRQKTEQKGGAPARASARATPPPDDKKIEIEEQEEPVDDQSARRQRQPACAIAEWAPTGRDYQAFLDRGTADGWLAASGDSRAAADRRFAEFCEWATRNELEPRSPANWSSTWRSWLAHVARHGEHRGRRSGRRSVFDLARGAVARPGAESPVQDI